jgi:antitoxin VapB
LLYREGSAVASTKLFKNGNSQAVRIPADLAYSRWDIELVIERQGDELRIRPARRRMGDVLGVFAQFSHIFAGGNSGPGKACACLRRRVRHDNALRRG